MSKNKIRLGSNVRDRLRSYADERDMTYDEALQNILPDEVDGNVLSRGEPAAINVSDDPYVTIVGLAGPGVDHGDVIKHYLREAER